MNKAVRIAMWSGPRNLSTALMRAFENRPDCAVVDEPFYAAYLAGTGLDHPMRAEVIASQPIDWRCVAERLVGPVPEGKAIFYQKHMTHHMLADFGRGWMVQCRNAFLIRAPSQVLASYVARREAVDLADIGIVQQAELFDLACDQLGAVPPVLDAADLRHHPREALAALCQALGIAFTPAMLRWPPGPRASDGVWAPAWYGSVHRSTGFAPPPTLGVSVTDLPSHLQSIARQADVPYRHMARFRLTPRQANESDRDGAENQR
jgi:hypothetical protein